MEGQDIYRTGWAPIDWRIAVFAALAIAILSLDTAADAQTRTARETAPAYGMRLNAKGDPASLNPNRINNRVNSRLETRLSLRVERYRPDSTDYPVAGFAVETTDDAHIGTETMPPSLTTSLLGNATSSQASSDPTDDTVILR